MGLENDKHLEGSHQYLRRLDLYKVEKPYQTTFNTEAFGCHETNLEYVESNVIFEDVQDVRDNFHLDIHGFEFHRWPTGLTDSEFDSDSAIVERYYTEILSYVSKARPSVTKIHIVDHLVRIKGTLSHHMVCFLTVTETRSSRGRKEQCSRRENHFQASAFQASASGPYRYAYYSPFLSHP